MLTLHNKDFTTKYGTINTTIEAFVEEERNGLFELSFIMLNTDSLFNYVKEDNIVVANANDTLLNQKFRIYMTRKLMNNRVEVFARHISFDLMYDYIDSVKFENQSCEYALNMLFRSSQFSTHYRGYSDIINAQDYNMSMANILEAIGGKEGSIIDTFGTGAEILRDNENIHVLNKRGHDNSVSIEYKKNLTGFELEEDTTDLVTRILPYAKYNDEENGEVIIKASFVDSPLIFNYSHPFIKAIDYTDKFEEGEAPTEDKLRALASNEYKNNKVDIPKQNFKIEFIPLSKCVGYEALSDSISLCDTVTIKDTRYNINTQTKVIKTTFNVLKNRYESMELGEPRTSLGDIVGNGGGNNEGPQGPQGPQGPPGADGNIGDFPNSLPSKSILTGKSVGLASIELTWTFENKVYYSYELYASKTKDFTPNTFDLIYEGQASAFLFQAKPNETWYFRVCAVNSHGNRNEFSEQIAVSTAKINGNDWIEEATIGNALIGELSADKITSGTISGHYIDARNLSVTDGNGKRTLDIDSFGNVNLDVTSLKIKSSTAVTKGELISSINVEPQGIKINTSKLLLDGDAGNKCQNPSFSAGDSDWYGGITVVSSIGSEAQYWGRTLANTYHFYGDEFNVTVGDTMYIGCHCKTYSGTGSFDLGLRIRTTTGERYFAIDKAYTSYVTWIETKITIPSNAISARLYVYSKNGSRWDFSNVMLRNAVNTELIVDGAIKANHVEAEEFRGMFNGASGMSKLDYNSLEFVDGNNAKFASFKQDKLNLFNWNKGYIGSLTRSHLAYPETSKEGTVQLSGQYGYFHDFGYNTSLSNENYDISSTSYTPLMRIQYRQSNYDSPGVYIRNKPLFVDSSMSMRGKVLHLNDSSRNYVQENSGRFELSVSSAGQFVMGSNSGSGVNWHFEFTPSKNSFFMRKNLNFEWSGYIYNTSIQNTYSDVQSRSFKETSTIESIHSQIRVPIKSNIVNGSCRIDVPSAFKNVMKDYIVTGLTKYGKGDIWIDEEYEDYFIVKADNDIKFALDLIINKQ